MWHRAPSLEHKDTLARGLRIEELIRLLCLIEAKAVREHPIHRDLTVGDKAGTVRLSNRVKRPGGENRELLADHVRTDIDGDVVAFPDKTHRPPGPRAAYGRDAGVRRSATIERQIGPFTVRQVFDRSNWIVGLWIDRDVRAKRLGEPQTLGTNVHRDDARAHSFGEHGGAQADRALAKNGNSVTAR